MRRQRYVNDPSEHQKQITTAINHQFLKRGVQFRESNSMLILDYSIQFIFHFLYAFPTAK